MRTLTSTWTDVLTSKLADYAQLVKFRLTTAVVFSALAGYAVAASGDYSIVDALLLCAGGFLISSAANAMNEYIERDSDKLMLRTAERPLPAGRMSFIEALLACGVMAVGGLSIIGVYFNEVAALVSALALISYAFLYTPLKRSGPVAVWVGAIPGALPPVIGYVSMTSQVTTEALVLFGIQFIWQFLHFWAIAWLADRDYARAGFRMLPSADGKSRASATHVTAFALLLALSGFAPWMAGMIPLWASIAVVLAALPVAVCAFKLLADRSDKSARLLLYTSFIYLPVALILIALA